jgi:NAD-dependent deacetylase
MQPIPDACIALVRAATRVVVLTGAGMSAESGIPTFRGQGGLWQGFRAEELASLQGFRRNPEVVWAWYRWRRERILHAEPHPGYGALAELARRRSVVIVTQNVDGLHSRSGETEVLELHGSIHHVRCVRPDCRLGDGPFPPGSDVPACACGELLRPAVVWFGEALPEETLESAHAAAARCEVALVVGTSSLVYPAAAIPFVAARNGASVIEINVDETPLSEDFDWSIRGPAGVRLPELVSRVLACD